MAPASASAASKSSPTRLNRRNACPSARPSAIADKSAENSTSSPSLSFFNGLTSADHVPSARGSRSVTSIFASDGPAAPSRRRMPNRRAGMTLVSLSTNRSVGRRMSGKSLTWRSDKPPLSAYSKRAEERGDTGRVAIRSSGRSKSKSLSFIRATPGFRPQPLAPNAAKQNPSLPGCGRRFAENFAKHTGCQGRQRINPNLRIACRAT